jgi:hypothetical protein
LGTRKYLKGRIRQIENSLGDIESVSNLSKLEVAIKSLDDALAKFEPVQIQLEIEKEEYAEEGAAILNKHYELYEKIHSVMSKIKVNKAETDINRPLPANNSNACHNQSLSLPKINLPTFSSDYTKWLRFKDLYVSLVHKNQELSDIKKFYY